MNDHKNITDSAREKLEKDSKAGNSSDTPKEVGGRKGPEPTRYGDWENNGIASDF